MALQAFAVYSDDDNSLNFYKRAEVPKVGEQFEGKTVTEVYTGFEESNPSNYPWSNRLSNILSVAVIDSGIAPLNTDKWFIGLATCKTIDVSKLDMGKSISAASMFENCYSIVSIDLSSWNIQNITNTSRMFYGCGQLKTVNLQGWKAYSLADTHGMFNGCGALAEINLIGLHSPNLYNTSNMFLYCKSIGEIDLSGFDMSNVSNANNMFKGLDSLESVVIGDKFSWVGTTGYLPIPSSSNIQGADGKWYALSDGNGYAPADIPSNKADTYYASKDLIPKATMYASVNNKARKITNAYVGAPGSVQLTMTNVETYFDTSNQGVYGSWDYPSYDKYTVRPDNGSLLAKNDTNMSFDYELYSHGITGLYNFYINSELICIFDASSRTTGKWSGTLLNGTAFTYEAKKNTDITDEVSAGIETRAPDISVYFTFSNIQASMPAVARKIKKAYIGVPTQIPIYEEQQVTKDVETLITPSNISNFFTVSDNAYKFVGDSSGKFTSNNKGHGSTMARSIWTAKKQIKKLTFKYKVSSEINYDEYTITVGDSTVANNISGNGIDKSYSGFLASGKDILLQYIKDSSYDGNDDCGTIWDIKVTTSETVTEQVQIGTETKEVARLCYEAPPMR